MDLAVAIAAALIALVALARSFVPPQARAVQELAARVELLELRAAQIGEAFTARERRQIAAEARAAKAEKAEQRRNIAEEAAALLLQQQQQAHQVSQQPETREQLKARLRAALLAAPDHRRH